MPEDPNTYERKKGKKRRKSASIGRKECQDSNFLAKGGAQKYLFEDLKVIGHYLIKCSLTN